MGQSRTDRNCGLESWMPPPHRSSARWRWHPDNGDIVLLAARMEAARGRVDEAVARLRRAVELDADGLRATVRACR